MRVARPESVEPVLLTVLLVAYFLAPSGLPIVGLTVHGIILLIASVYYAAADRTFRWCDHWPFAAVLASIIASWLWAGGYADFGAIRAIGFGILAAFLFGLYLRGEAAIRALRLLSRPVFAMSIVMISLYVAAVFGASVTTFDLFEWMGQSSYHSGMFSLFAVPIALHASIAKKGRLELGWLLPLWIVIFLSGLRALWIGGFAAMLVFGIAARRLSHTIIAFGIAVAAFAVVIVVTNQYLARPLVVDDQLSSSTRIAASNLRAKISVESGGDKFREELSSSGRLGYWLAGLKMWAASPVFGVGPGNFSKNSGLFSVAGPHRRDAEDQFDAHNLFVSVLAELGVVGFVALLALLLLPTVRWLRLWRRFPSRRDSLALFAALFVGLTAAGLTWDMHMQRVWWISVGLLWAATIPEGSENVAGRPHVV